MLEAGCGSGCLLWRAARVAALLGAIESSELASRIAPLKSPSSSLEATLAARV